MNKVQKIMSVIVLAVVVALPAKAQMFGQTASPITAFRSTSTMVGSGSSYSSSPMLNEDGTASLNGGTSGSYRAKKNTPSSPGSPSTPGQGQQENQFPVGDAVLPLMLMAMLFTGTVYYRRKKTVVKG